MALRGPYVAFVRAQDGCREGMPTSEALHLQGFVVRNDFAVAVVHLALNVQFAMCPLSLGQGPTLWRTPCSQSELARPLCN
jgi:hypothetical protein